MKILIVIGVVIGLRLVAGLFAADEPAVAASAGNALPPPPRKSQRRRAVAKPAALPSVTPEPVMVKPVAKVVPSVAAANPRLAAFLRGRAAQRQAFIAGEVLGRPLSLR